MSNETTNTVPHMSWKESPAEGWVASFKIRPSDKKPQIGLFVKFTNDGPSPVSNDELLDYTKRATQALIIKLQNRLRPKLGEYTDGQTVKVELREMVARIARTPQKSDKQAADDYEKSNPLGFYTKVLSNLENAGCSHDDTAGVRSILEQIKAGTWKK